MERAYYMKIQQDTKQNPNQDLSFESDPRFISYIQKRLENAIDDRN